MNKSIARQMKQAVNFLGKRPLASQLFFWSTFYNVRLMYPLQYLILRELMDCRSILDLGCGPHSMVPILPDDRHTVGVELFEPYYKEATEKKRHKEIIHGDLTQVSFEPKSFDAVVMLDVIEHLSKEEGAALLEKMQRWARKKVVVFTPNGYFHQDEYDENPYMAHKSGWEVGDFKSRGFKVYGVRGLKSMKKDHHTEEGSMNSLADITQVWTYYRPESAFQLFCVKELNG